MPDPTDSPPVTPLVTVVLPVRDGAAHLPAARAGIESLTGPALEVLVVDDGSTDASADLLAAWAAADPRVHVLTEPEPRGVAHARNRALSVARGEYVWLVDADDTWEPDALDVLVEAAQRAGADVVVCDARRTLVHDDTSIPPTPASPLLDAAAGATTGEEMLRAILRGALQGHLWNKLFRRETLGTAPFPEQRAHSDLAGLLGVLASGRVGTVTAVPRPLYTYGMRHGSILRSDAYDPHDLEGCLAAGWRAAGIPGGPDAAGSRARAAAAGRTQDLALFTHGLVTVPVVNEHLRRGHDARETARLTRPQRARVRPADVLTILRAGRWSLAARTVAVRWALPLHAAVYRAYRRRRYGAHDRRG